MWGPVLMQFHCAYDARTYIKCILNLDNIKLYSYKNSKAVYLAYIFLHMYFIYPKIFWQLKNLPKSLIVCRQYLSISLKVVKVLVGTCVFCMYLCKYVFELLIDCWIDTIIPLISHILYISLHQWFIIILQELRIQ